MSFLARLRFEFHRFRLLRMQAARRRRMLVDHQPHRTGFVFGAPYRDMRGFTLLELMITVGIVALLAALALPAYANYSVRAAASEGIQMADAAETAVSESYQATGVAPGNAGEAGYSQQVGKYVSSIAVGGAGVVSVTYGGAAPSAINGTVLSLTPYLTSDGITLGWVCAYGSVPTGWHALTADAAGSGNPAPVTSIGAQYLPKACRTGG